jgi:hypothetical protein
VLAQVVSGTEGFSFAYMKELFLSSMMQWMSAPEPKSMRAIILDCLRRLREQMTAMAEEPGETFSLDTDTED